jgi:hypothetical protein
VGTRVGWLQRERERDRRAARSRHARTPIHMCTPLTPSTHPPTHPPTQFIKKNAVNKYELPKKGAAAEVGDGKDEL